MLCAYWICYGGLSTLIKNQVTSTKSLRATLHLSDKTMNIVIMTPMPMTIRFTRAMPMLFLINKVESIE